jgi:hypothetical protein
VHVWVEVLVRVTLAIWWPVAPCQAVTFAASCVARQMAMGLGVGAGVLLGVGTALGTALGATEGASEPGPTDGPGVVGPEQPIRPSVRPMARRALRMRSASRNDLVVIRRSAEQRGDDPIVFTTPDKS